MSEMQEIDFVITTDGCVQMTVRGVSGQKCLEITRSLENALGGKVLVRTYTDEFYQNNQELDQYSFQTQTGGNF